MQRLSTFWRAQPTIVMSREANSPLIVGFATHLLRWPRVSTRRPSPTSGHRVTLERLVEVAIWQLHAGALR